MFHLLPSHTCMLVGETSEQHERTNSTITGRCKTWTEMGSSDVKLASTLCEIVKLVPVFHESSTDCLHVVFSSSCHHSEVSTRRCKGIRWK